MVEIDGVRETKSQQDCPLSIWTDNILKLTELDLDLDIRPSYLIMLEEVDRSIFQGQLSCQS